MGRPLGDLSEWWVPRPYSGFPWYPDPFVILNLKKHDGIGPERVDFVKLNQEWGEVRVRGEWEPCCGGVELRPARGEPVDLVANAPPGPTGNVRYRADGREILVQRDAPEHDEGGDPPERKAGDINGFSASSARRLRQLFDTLRRNASAIFVTVTYSNRSPGAEEAKKNLHAYLQALRRRYDAVRASMIWRMEWQANGTPHFHLLIYGIDWDSKEALKKIWHRISGEADAAERKLKGPERSPRWGKVRGETLDTHDVRTVYPGPPHRGLGAWIEGFPENDAEKVRNYIQKYHCKDADHEPPAEAWEGRHWGVRCRKHLPTAPITEVRSISYRLAYEITELCMEAWGREYVPSAVHISAEDPQSAVDALIREAKKRLNGA